MIVNQTRIQTGGADTVIAHVNKTDENEVCERVIGYEDDLYFADQLAAMESKKYSIRHFNISPAKDLTDAQYDRMIEILNEEFGFTDRSIGVWKHVKKRTNDTAPAHYHVLAAEQNDFGKTMCNRANYARNEKVSRMMEIEFGHEIVSGAHNRSVAAALGLDGSELDTDTQRARAAFSSDEHRHAERLGLNLPVIVSHLKQLRDQDPVEKGRGLSDIEKRFGVHFRMGDRSPSILMEYEGELIFVANRALGAKSEQVSDILGGGLAAYFHFQSIVSNPI